jgi:hypothetical protein
LNDASVTLQNARPVAYIFSSMCSSIVWEVSWPVGKALWSTTSTFVSVASSSRARPLTPDSAHPKFGTPRLKVASCLSSCGAANSSHHSRCTARRHHHVSIWPYKPLVSEDFGPDLGHDIGLRLRYTLVGDPLISKLNLKSSTSAAPGARGAKKPDRTIFYNMASRLHVT